MHYLSNASFFMPIFLSIDNLPGRAGEPGGASADAGRGGAAAGGATP
jgi:hypothetical protein